MIGSDSPSYWHQLITFHLRKSCSTRLRKPRRTRRYGSRKQVAADLFVYYAVRVSRAAYGFGVAELDLVVVHFFIVTTCVQVFTLSLRFTSVARKRRMIACRVQAGTGRAPAPTSRSCLRSRVPEQLLAVAACRWRRSCRAARRS